jgi:hypothetical protein
MLMADERTRMLAAEAEMQALMGRLRPKHYDPKIPMHREAALHLTVREGRKRHGYDPNKVHPNLRQPSGQPPSSPSAPSPSAPPDKPADKQD